MYELESVKMYVKESLERGEICVQCIWKSAIKGNSFFFGNKGKMVAFVAI